MSAVVVQDIYKKFGKPSEPFWKRMLQMRASDANIKSENGYNGNGNGHHNGNGHTPEDREAVQSMTKIAPVNGKSNGNGNGHKPKQIVAVNHISFSVEKGEIFGVLGPNGGGKSTLIRLISTLLLPDSGKITVFDHDVEKRPMDVQR